MRRCDCGRCDCGTESDVGINSRLGQEATIRVARLRPAFGSSVLLWWLERIADVSPPAVRTTSFAVGRRDLVAIAHHQQRSEPDRREQQRKLQPLALLHPDKRCLLYTSDAADDLLCVDLG